VINAHLEVVERKDGEKIMLSGKCSDRNTKSSEQGTSIDFSNCKKQYAVTHVSAAATCLFSFCFQASILI
jgi:hypothetical protein